jgi:cellulose synthase/poly-beta-1,6-N-acetylglucosamine synthase-like glycosyltransferase/transposase-like protein
MPAKLTAQKKLQLIKKVINGASVTSVAKEAGVSRVVFYRWFDKYKKDGARGLVAGLPGRPKGNSSKTNKRLSSRERFLMVKEVVDQHQEVVDVSDKYGISRTTIYKWIERYKNQLKEENEPDLSSRTPVVSRYYRETPSKHVGSVLALVSAHPEYGIRKIVSNLPKVGNTPIVGHHGVQNILRRHGLLHYEDRLRYSESLVTPISKSIGLSLLPFREFFNFSENLRIKLVKYLGLIAFSLFTTVVTMGSVNFLQNESVDGLSKFGLFFASTALFMGSVFFLYSLKYYISLAIVLSYTNKEQGEVPGQTSKLLSWILGLEQKITGKTNVYGLESEMGKIKLATTPFVSVHIPFYNEKNVVRRAIEAAVSFKYPSYEIILCDDSTDATTGIIRDYQKSCLLKGEDLKITRNDSEGWELTEVEVKPGVHLKHLHRTARKGFKGQALAVALRLVNLKTEFIAVFDADFVPYPDSLELFLKYFQHSSKTGNLGDLGNIGAVQGYQWHVLNKSENWITRGIRSEYSGSYVIERSSAEIYGGLKQISGSVYMIRRDVLENTGWGSSITEDFELTLRMYEKGYKVLYTPYIQAPAECVSTLKRLVRQRMRWAEGHSFNVKRMFWPLMKSNSLTFAEKMELLYLTPYYLQAFFFIVGTFAWLISETIFRTRLPFWTETWGWSLIITNMIALPLLNAVGLFMEEGEEKDYMGLGSFIATSYILVPFQAYAAVKGLLETSEGPWFRTPKTGRITDIFQRNALIRFIQRIIPSEKHSIEKKYLGLTSSNNRFESFAIRPAGKRWVGKLVVSILLGITVTVYSISNGVPEVYATDWTTLYLRDTTACSGTSGLETTAGSTTQTISLNTNGQTVNWYSPTLPTGTADGNMGPGDVIFTLEGAFTGTGGGANISIEARVRLVDASDCTSNASAFDQIWLTYRANSPPPQQHVIQLANNLNTPITAANPKRIHLQLGVIQVNKDGGVDLRYNNSTSGNNSRLDVTGMTVPEVVLWLSPLILAIPFLIKKIKHV